MMHTHRSDRDDGEPGEEDHHSHEDMALNGNCHDVCEGRHSGSKEGLEQDLLYHIYQRLQRQ